MGIFSKLAITFKSNKKSNAYLPDIEEPISISEDTVKCAAMPYKTIASFDLNIEKPKYEIMHTSAPAPVPNTEEVKQIEFKKPFDTDATPASAPLPGQ